MKDDNLKQNTNSAEDIKLYGEKIFTIQSKLNELSNTLVSLNYGCYYENNIVISNLFSLKHPHVNINHISWASDLIKQKQYNHKTIINFLTAKILYEWLAKDYNAQQTFTNFAKKWSES